ncbi:MAG: hypothetical protein OHK005_07500 [Candidatus Methylacidiphilales bacterium]
MNDSRLAEQILDSLLDKAVRQSWPIGHVLSRESQESDAVFYVLEGYVSVRKDDVQLHRAGPGSLLGEMGVLTGQPRSADLVAASDIHVLRMEAADFLRAVDSHPAIMRAMIRDLCGKLDAMNTRSTEESSQAASADILSGALKTDRLRELVGLRAAASERSCWARIGVWGDNSCPELDTHHHCHNCPVYAGAGRKLLDRPAPPGYLETWAQTLTIDTPSTAAQASSSIMIFRLGADWLGLPANVFKETTTPRTLHRIPHRTNRVLRGLVNIRGELLPLFSLRDLLNLEPGDQAPSLSRRVYQRFAVLEAEDGRWVAPLDEVAAIERIPSHELGPVPSTLSGGAGTFAKGIFSYQGQRVALLDHDLIFYNLTKNFL